MNAATTKRSVGQRVTAILMFALFCIVIIYGPLVAHCVERKVFKTDKVSQACNAIGVTPVLEFIYQNTPGLGR